MAIKRLIYEKFQKLRVWSFSCLVVIHHFPGKRERSRFWQPVASCNNPEFLSGTQLDKEGGKRAEAEEQLAPTEQRTWLWSGPLMNRWKPQAASLQRLIRRSWWVRSVAEKPR